MAIKSYGDLYGKVGLQAPVPYVDDYGSTVEGWQDMFDCRANLRTLRGGETVIAARLQGVQVLVITIPASNAAALIEPSWRMVNRNSGDLYNIRSIVRTDDRKFYEITAEKGVTV